MTDDFVSEIINFIGATVEECEQTRIQVQKELVASVISDTPVDSGMARRNWQAQKDSVPTSVIPYAGDPSAAQAQAVSAAQSVAFGEDGTFYFANNVHYVYYLEFGTSRMAARGMARKNSQRIADNLRARYG